MPQKNQHRNNVTLNFLRGMNLYTTFCTNKHKLVTENMNCDNTNGFMACGNLNSHITNFNKCRRFNRYSIPKNTMYD